MSQICCSQTAFIINPELSCIASIVLIAQLSDPSSQSLPYLILQALASPHISNSKHCFNHAGSQTGHELKNAGLTKVLVPITRIGGSAPARFWSAKEPCGSGAGFSSAGVRF